MNAFGLNRLRASALPSLWLALIWVVADQVTKVWAETHLMVGEPVAVWPHLNWTLAYNYGAAFSFLADHDGWQTWFFSILALVVSVALIIWLARLPRGWSTEVVGLNLILGGAIGNVIDRIQAGRVTDFIDFYIGSWHYATFNIADIAISLGAFLLILSEFWLKPRAQKRKAQA